MFSLSHLARVRAAEFEAIARDLPPNSRVLDLGAGTGQQASMITHAGHEVTALDVPGSEYAKVRIFPVEEYPGERIPYPDGSFDIVFSSNVLEHVGDLDSLQREIRRVLRPGGYCLHVLPTNTWRLWTWISALPGVLLALSRGRVCTALKTAAFTLLLRPHGERGTALSELWTFRPSTWKSRFLRQGFAVEECRPVGLFYTGEMVLQERLPMSARARIARWLGSSTYLFKIKPVQRASTVSVSDARSSG